MDIKLNDFTIGADKLTVLAGPCVIESQQILNETACELQRICKKLDINYVFKSSFDKANRSSINSYRGPGMEKGLKMLQEVKSKYGVPIITDIHLPSQAAVVSEVADILQIPAFLCRQTDLLVAAAKTGKIINIKKGQFLAPQQVKPLVQKAAESGNTKILITDRGVCFGYNNLVTDFRAISIMKEFGCPIVFDATHSVQMPGSNINTTGGDRKYVPLLAKAAMAAGADALFFEIHPDPQKALCDGATMLYLESVEEVFTVCKEIYEVVRK